MPPSIIRDLRLREFGYEVYPMDGTYAPIVVADADAASVRL